MKKYSRPWQAELGATHQQVALSLRRGPWALEWNGQTGFLLWDEWRWHRCLWSPWLAEYWGAASRGCLILPSKCVCHQGHWWLPRSSKEQHLSGIASQWTWWNESTETCVCVGCLLLVTVVCFYQCLLFSHHSNMGWQMNSIVMSFWDGSERVRKMSNIHIWKNKAEIKGGKYPHYINKYMARELLWYQSLIFQLRQNREDKLAWRALFSSKFKHAHMWCRSQVMCGIMVVMNVTKPTAGISCICVLHHRHFCPCRLICIDSISQWTKEFLSFLKIFHKSFKRSSYFTRRSAPRCGDIFTQSKLAHEWGSEVVTMQPS